MIVWGGYDDHGYSNVGYRYDPATDAWSYVTAVGAPSARVLQGAVWTGRSMVVWGGTSGLVDYNDGAEWFPSEGAPDASFQDANGPILDASSPADVDASPDVDASTEAGVTTDAGGDAMDAGAE
jgi:hypothetical protein